MSRILTLKKLSAPLRTMLVTISALMLMFTVLSIILIMIFKSMSEKDAADYVNMITENYGASVDAKLNNYLTGIDVVSLNKMLRDNMWNPHITEMEMVSLGTQMQRNVDSITYSFYKSGDIYRHTIYSYLPTDGSYFFNLSRAAQAPWYVQMSKSGSTSMQWYSYSNITKSTHLNIAKSINRYGVANVNEGLNNCYQTISINLSSLLISSPESFNENFESLYMIDNQTQEMVYTNSSDHKREVMAYYKKERLRNEDGLAESTAYITTTDNKKSNMAMYQLKEVDMCIAVVFPRSETLTSNALARNIVLWLFVVPVFVLLVFLLFFYRVFRSRLEHVVGNIDNFNERSEIVIKPLMGNDELARIDRHLIRMLARTKTLIKENYIQKMGKITARLEALTACINPHFLYNTLNTISAMACMDGAEDTVSMINSLSSMFRYASSVSDKLVPLRLEIENISEYLSIQNTRYQGRLLTKIDIAEEFMDILVPKLTLQPVVENCFKHGFNAGITTDTDVKEIVVSGVKTERELRLYVRDNGSGISECEVENLRRKLSRSDITDTDDDGKIGMQNINNRIRLICGSQYGIDITSEEGCFTQVEMRFPLITCND